MTAYKELTIVSILECYDAFHLYIGPSPDLKLPIGEGVLEHLFDKKMYLNYAFNCPNPATNLVINEHGIEAYLSFGGKPSYTFVPWESVIAVRCDGGLVHFAEPVQVTKAPLESVKAPSTRKKSHLKLVH